MPVACDFGFGWDLLFVSARLPFAAVIEDVFLYLVCALCIRLTCPFKNVSVKLVNCVYRICLFVVQCFAYILGVLLCCLGGL